MASTTASSIGAWVNGLMGTSGTVSQASTATQAMMQQAASLTPGMVQQYQQQLANTPYPGQQWTTTTTPPQPWPTPYTTQDEVQETWDKWRKEFTEEVEAEFADLHNKLDKMYEILQGLVKVEIPTDEIRKALDADTFNRTD